MMGSHFSVGQRPGEGECMEEFWNFSPFPAFVTLHVPVKTITKGVKVKTCGLSDCFRGGKSRGWVY